MMPRIIGGERRKEVLRLLAEHGPLSIRSLEVFIQPNISRKKLNVVLSRMFKRNLIARRNYRLFGGCGVFYQIAQQETGRRQAAEILGVSTESLLQPGYRNAELLHSESCAQWSEFLKLIFPQGEVLREQAFRGRQDIASVLLTDAEDRDFIPDVMVILPTADPERKVYLAVEVERSAKSRARLRRKLKKYADESRIDGLVYVCDSNWLSARLRDVYGAFILKQNGRIKHYSENFFLFTDGSMPVGGLEPLMFNASLEKVSLQSWAQVLCANSLFERSEKKFPSGVSLPPP